MWFVLFVLCAAALYVSARIWGRQFYYYYRRKLPYILPYQRKIRPPTPTLSVVETDRDIAAKKFDVDLSVIITKFCERFLFTSKHFCI